MIERLNFYDVYGYVVPGFAFVALCWLPFGLVGRGWPTTEWASAAAALATSYVVGFLLHRIGTKAVPSTTMNGRYPSDAILDEPKLGDGHAPQDTFSKEFRTELQKLIQKDFSLDIANALLRRDAFFACRAALLANKRGQYCEQFEGLYAMSRGLLLAFGAAAPYYLGWWLSSVLEWARWQCIALWLAFVLCIPLVFAVRRKTQWIRVPSVRIYLFFAPLAFDACIFGFCGAGTNIGGLRGRTLLAGAIASALSCFLFWEGYRDYTVSFARQVYSDYYAMKKLPAPSTTD